MLNDSLGEDEECKIVVKKVEDDIKNGSFKPKKDEDIIEYAKKNNLPVGWVELVVYRLNPLSEKQLEKEIKDLERRLAKVNSREASTRAQIIRKEVNASWLAQAIDDKKEQLRILKKSQEEGGKK